MINHSPQLPAPASRGAGAPLALVQNSRRQLQKVSSGTNRHHQPDNGDGLALLASPRNRLHRKCGTSKSPVLQASIGEKSVQRDLLHRERFKQGRGFFGVAVVVGHVPHLRLHAGIVARESASTLPVYFHDSGASRNAVHGPLTVSGGASSDQSPNQYDRQNNPHRDERSPADPLNVSHAAISEVVG